MKSATLRRFFQYLWQGPSTLPQSLQLEWRLVAVRWLGIIIMTPAIPLAHLSPSSSQAAYAVVFFAAVYNLIIQLCIRYRPSVFTNGYVTAIGDTLLTIAMIKIGGGFGTPFYYLLFTVTIAEAMRYGYGPSLATVIIVVYLDLLESGGSKDAIDATFVMRSGFLLITAVLAGYLRDQARRAEGALQERLRQADSLNQATATLGASLEFEPALRAVAAAACNLFGGNRAVLQTATGLEDVAGGTFTVTHHTKSERDGEGQHDDLAALCAQYTAKPDTLGNVRSLVRRQLPGGQQALALTLALPTRKTSLATLALSLPSGQRVPTLDPDILDSFVERTTLALENASLYRTLASRTDDLQRAYSDLAIAHQELLGVDEMKTGFLANVSHELRTPLSSIRSFSELLLSYENDPTVQNEFLHIINSESERLTRLVNDVLDITKIEAGRMDWHIAPVDLAAVLQDSARTYVTLIEEHDLVFRQEIDADLPMIYADRDRLQQVLGNMLNNAMKFTEAGTITLSAVRLGEEVRVSVIDTGVGIAREDHERIFEKFQQVVVTLTDKPRGTGLGLCFCRDFIAYHNGRLWVESDLGRGSTFTFAVPIPEMALQPLARVSQAA
jgi:signal transduction histidine kinase